MRVRFLPGRCPPPGAWLAATAGESWPAQGDLVRLGDVVGCDCPKAFAQAFAGLPQQLERVGRARAGGGTLQIGPMLLDEMRLKGRSDLVDCLQAVVDGPVPCGGLNHRASIAPVARSR